jgi:hypothetical protein
MVIPRTLDVANGTDGAVSEHVGSACSEGTAAGFGVHVVAVRIISDSESQSSEFQRVAGEYLAAFVVEVVSRLRMLRGRGRSCR